MSSTIKKSAVTALFMSVLTCSLGLPLKAETLRQAMSAAYNNSGLLEQNRALLRAADEDVAQAAAALRPVANWSASIRDQRGWTQSASMGDTRVFNNSPSANLAISAELTLFDGGQNKMALEASKEAVLATRQALVSVEQQILFAAVDAYMKLRRELETVGLRENNLLVIQEELRAAQDRFDVGEITKTDVAVAEARLAASTSALAAARGAYIQAQEAYQQAIGAPAGELAEPSSTPKLPDTVEAVKSAAVRNHPDMRRIQHEIKQAELNVSRAKASIGTSVKLSGSLSYTDQDADDFSAQSSVSVSASGPIYSGGRLPSLVRQAMARRDAQRSGLHITRHRIEQQAGSAFALLEMAQAGRKASEEQIRAARVAFEGVREEATLGSRTTLDVLNAEQELLDAKAGLISAVTDEYLAAYRVLSEMGKLTADALNLPVQKYDPTEYFNLVETAPSVGSAQGKALDRVLEALSK